MQDTYFDILTYGCQMNDYDSRVIASILSNDGYKEVNELDKADVIIVNTCSVREHAEKRALGRISDLQRLRKLNPNLLIGVVGCMAQNLGDSIKGVDFIVGPSNYRGLPGIIREAKSNLQLKLSRIDARKTCLEENLDAYSDIFPEPDNGATAFVPVMRGCSNFCSYCVVPYVRGPARSRPHQDILKEIKFLASKGIKEITLLGQSVNEYSSDGVSFPKLLKLIDEVECGVPWIKFTTSHPKNMSLELINVMRDAQCVCEWLHLPLQSGSNKILTLMNRRYTEEEYLDWIYKIRKSISSISITTDIMVGFPGESEADFNETLAVVKLVRFDFAYMFKYSERPGTRAYHLGPKIPEEVKGEMLSKLINVQNKITYEENRELVGTTQEVLVLGKSKRPVPTRNGSGGNSWYGKTRQDKVVVLEGKVSPGDFVKVKIESLHGWTPYGRVS